MFLLTFFLFRLYILHNTFPVIGSLSGKWFVPSNREAVPLLYLFLSELVHPENWCFRSEDQGTNVLPLLSYVLWTRVEFPVRVYLPEGSPVSYLHKKMKGLVIFSFLLALTLARQRERSPRFPSSSCLALVNLTDCERPNRGIQMV